MLDRDRINRQRVRTAAPPAGHAPNKSKERDCIPRNCKRAPARSVSSADELHPAYMGLMAQRSSSASSSVQACDLQLVAHRLTDSGGARVSQCQRRAVSTMQ